MTYLVNVDENTAGFFSVSNDSIRKEDVPRTAYKRVAKFITREKRYKGLPAVKVGRLGVASEYQLQGLGTMIMDFIKMWFTVNNKTGCRFITIDAYAQADKPATEFYIKNGFKFLTENDKEDKTRLMYFDLITFKE